MRNYFTFGNTVGAFLRSYVYGIYIESPPTVNSAARNVEKINIPGAMRPLLYDRGGYENVTRTYNVFFAPDKTYPMFMTNGMSVDGGLKYILARLQETATGVLGFTKTGYMQLTDTYTQDVNGYSMQYLARYMGGSEYENSLLLHGRGQIRFDCLPQIYITKTNDTTNINGIELTNISTTEKSGTIKRPQNSELYARNAFPQITVEFENECTLQLTVNSYPMSITLHKHDTGTEKLIIDSEMQNAWYENTGVAYPANSDITFQNDGMYPTLDGILSQTVKAKTTSGTVAKITVESRWFIIA